MFMVKLSVCPSGWEPFPSSDVPNWYPLYFHPDEIRRVWNDGEDFHYVTVLTRAEGDSSQDLRVLETAEQIARVMQDVWS